MSEFAIIVKLPSAELTNKQADAVIKRIRDVGIRAIATNPVFSQACQKYTIKQVDSEVDFTKLPTDPVTTLQNNLAAGKTCNWSLTIEQGFFSQQTNESLEQLNSFMHQYGHLVNEGKPCNLAVVNGDGFCLKNKIASYQDYVFVKSPSQSIQISGLEAAPNRIVLVKSHAELEFSFQAGLLTITDLPADHSNLTVIRIQEHRAEDDLESTEY